MAGRTTRPKRSASKNAPAYVSRPGIPTHEAIARRAYEIYRGRGSDDGHDLDDWLQAEREIGVPPKRRES
jgi:hypothetical protein